MYDYMGTSNPDVETIESTSGDSYQVLKIPSEVTLEYVESQSYQGLGGIGGLPTHHAYVQCQEISDNLLPIEANPREPGDSGVVKDMRNTLEDTPGEFVKWNNGLTIICESINIDDTEKEIKFNFVGEKEGICNGGHTYYAIETTSANLTRAGVHLEIIEISSEVSSDERRQTIVDIASKRNAVNNLDNSSRADFLQLYNVFKERLSDSRKVSWHENDSDAYDDAIKSTKFIRNLKILDPESFHHPIVSKDKGNHKGAATGPGGTHTSWFNDALENHKNDQNPPLYNVSVLADDIFDLADYISHSILYDDDFPAGLRRRSFYQEVMKDDEDEPVRTLSRDDLDNDTGLDLNSPVEAMLLGAFRSNVYLYNSDPDTVEYVGWIKDPESVWELRKTHILSQLSDLFEDANKEYQGFIHNNAPYNIEIYTHSGLEPEWPSPPAEILYDIDENNKYVYCADGDGDFYIDLQDGNGLVEIEDTDDVESHWHTYK